MSNSVPAASLPAHIRTTVRAAVALCVALSAAIPGGSDAAVQHFASRLEDASWQVQTAHARCVLRHAVADYGTAEFVREAGRGLRLRVDVPKAPIMAVEAGVRSVPPPWNHRASPTLLATRLMEPGSSTLEIEGADAETLLKALEQGLAVELSFGPAGGPAQAIVIVSAVRLQLSLPEFEQCSVALRAAPSQPQRLSQQTTAGSNAENVRWNRPAARPPVKRAKKPAESAPEFIEDPFIRTDVVRNPAVPASPVSSADESETVAAARPAGPRQETGSGLGLVDELQLSYAPDQDELSEGARIELGSLAREYLAQRRRDVVLIAGSAAHGPLTRRRALEIKGYLVRIGLPPTHVLIHVPGEKLPQRDGRPVDVPGDATRMVVWQVR